MLYKLLKNGCAVSGAREVNKREWLFIDGGNILNSKNFRLLVISVERKAMIGLGLSHKLGNSSESINSKTFVAAVGLDNCTYSCNGLLVLIRSRSYKMQTDWVCVIAVTWGVIDCTRKWNCPSRSKIVNKKWNLDQLFLSKCQSSASWSLEYIFLLQHPHLKSNSVAFVTILCSCWYSDFCLHIRIAKNRKGQSEGRAVRI